MNYLKFDIESCKDCYSCLRSCPVKSIRFVNGKAEIIEESCILCGHCVNVCPQNAKKVVSNIEDVQNLIRRYPGKVALSVAPSFITNFPVNSFASFKAAAMKLGFSFVEETARGAHYVTEEYLKCLKSGKYTSLITTACPAAVHFICQNYPKAIKYMAPVVSPMIAHGRILKQELGEDCHIVFVGPCIAKKKEAYESKEIDYALTFEEFEKWLENDNIAFEEKDEEGVSYNDARFYPIQRGVIKSFGASLPKNYDSFSIDGVEEIRDILENIDELDHIFIEMNMCKGGCVNGPARNSKRSSINDSSAVRKYAKNAKGVKKEELKTNVKVDLSTQYEEIPNIFKQPSEDEITKILNHIFKYRKEDEINCGACGYNTCRAKAISVYNGLTDPEFCMPYLKNKAESISNEIIQHTPNGIITVNKEGCLIDINERAFEYLQIDKTALGHYYQEFIDLPDLMTALENGENVSSVVVFNATTNRFFDVSITVVKEHGVAFAIYKDVTAVMLNDEKMRNLRKEMIEVTDKVINKQMAAVQEIASLLGESTAEAKVALVNFKNSLKDQDK